MSIKDSIYTPKSADFVSLKIFHPKYRKFLRNDPLEQ